MFYIFEAPEVSKDLLWVWVFSEKDFRDEESFASLLRLREWHYVEYTNKRLMVDSSV